MPSIVNVADSTGTFVSNVTLAREPQKTVAHDENKTTAATYDSETGNKFFMILSINLVKRLLNALRNAVALG